MRTCKHRACSVSYLTSTLANSPSIAPMRGRHATFGTRPGLHALNSSSCWYHRHRRRRHMLHHRAVYMTGHTVPQARHHHRHRLRHVSFYNNMLGKPGPQALEYRPPRPWNLGPPVLPCTTLGGHGPYKAAERGVATRHSCGCVVLPQIGHTRKSPLSHSGGWDHMQSSHPHPSQSDLSHRLLAWGALSNHERRDGRSADCCWHLPGQL
jgi:hypothetical protein